MILTGAARRAAAVVTLAACLPAPWAAAAELEKGYRLLVDRGLQIQAQCFAPFELAPFRAANFTTVNSHRAAANTFLGAAPGVPWGRWTMHPQETSLTTPELPYAGNFVSFQLGDEQNLNDPQVRLETRQWFDAVRPAFPQTLLLTNQQIAQVTTPNLVTYINESNPDLVMFDDYPFVIGGPSGGSPTAFYGEMQRYRRLGLGQFGTSPRPYGMYLQTFADAQWRMPSESELRLNQFAAWTFGYTFTSAFRYDHIYPGQPTPPFDQVAQVNRQSRALGPALVRLKSADLRFIAGEHLSGSEPAPNPAPADIPLWAPLASDPYITGITATSLSGANDGLRGDVLVGYFNVLDESFDGAAHDGEIYFMITNGLCAPDPALPASDVRQRITVDFDFGSSGIHGLQRLGRETGNVEPVALEPLGGSSYRFSFELDGGTGDLFKFDTGAPFVPLFGDANLDGAVNLTDFNRLAANFGSREGVWSRGDFDYDGDVDLADFNRLAANFGQSVGAGGPTPADWATLAAAVPEPSASIAWGTGAALLSARRREVRTGTATRSSGNQPARAG